MSYQVIARKYRPLTFDDVVGQAHVKTPLRNAIRSGRIPHALLLTGPRGTGKTTLARIVACCLNADKGPTETPSPEDPACLEIRAGTSTDVQEVDAASRTSVDDMREVIDSIRYAAAPGKWRIFIVDEVHMLSTPAFNALLKTLEEPPPQSLFIFCTTNPEKIPFTVLSRCQRYDLRRIATAEVATALAEIATAEGIEISRQSLLAVARAGDGSMRDAQTLLDQLIAFGGTQIDDDRVADVLDLIDRQLLIRIMTACIDGDAASGLEAARQAFDSGVDAKRLGAELLATIRDLVVLRVSPESGLVEASDAELEALRQVANQTEEARLRRMFRALLREQEDLAWAPDPYAVLEMAVIRLAGMPAGDQVEALLARIDALERNLAGGSGGSGGPSGGRATQPRGTGGADGNARQGGRGRSATPAQETPTAESKADEPAPERTRPTSAPVAEPLAVPVPVAPVATQPEGASEPEMAVATSAPAFDGEASLDTIFDRLRAFGQDRNRGLFAALEGGRLLDRSAGKLRIGISSSTAVRRLDQRTGELEDICTEFFGESVRIQLVALPGAGGKATPAVQTADNEPDVAAAARKQRQDALQHEAVNDALEVLRAEILEIKPNAERQPGDHA